MYKMMINIIAILFSSCILCNCVEDKSTMGEDVVSNDNTYAPMVVRSAMNEQQQKVVNYFFTGANEQTGMALNSSSNKTILTTGATGFGIMNLIIGVERGWINREEAARQIVKITRFLKRADRFAGAWAHWYKPDGRMVPFGSQMQAGEIVETAFMMGGLLTASEYFTGGSDDEKEIRKATEEFWNSIEWNHFVKDGMLYWIWHQDKNSYELPLVGWNETLLVYILAMAAPDAHKVSPDIYKNCWQGYNFANLTRKTYGYSLPLGTDDNGGPLFLSQYSFLGLDPRYMQDQYAFYWTQNVSHTLINRHYCVYEAPKEYRYSEYDWGLTACEGCGEHPDYMSRDPKNDDGIIAPTAALSAFPYTPFYSTQVLLNLKNNYSDLNGKYGFGVSYCPADKSVGKNYLAMEHAPIAIMMENYRSGLIWKLLMQNEHVQKGLQLAGIAQPIFQPGFNLAVVNSETGVYDMMRHPDREKYELDFYTNSSGKGTLVLSTSQGEDVYRENIDLSAGVNTISFFDKSIVRGKKYKLSVIDSDKEVYSMFVFLR